VVAAMPARMEHLVSDTERDALGQAADGPPVAVATQRHRVHPWRSQPSSCG
jgi:hypothetical protein